MKTYAGPRIDAHAHAGIDARLERAVAFVEERNLRWHNVAGNPARNVKLRRTDVYRRMHEARPDLFAWGTGFPPVDLRDPHFIGRVLRQLEEDFAAGATCCKFWRDIGMSVRKPDGRYLLIDDPFLEPIFSFLEGRGKTALLHTGEPFARWPEFATSGALPATGRIFKPLLGEYAVVDFPGFRAQMDAEENVVRRHPRLRFVGAHLAGFDYDVAAVAKLLDRCPNLAVDTSGRRQSLAVQETSAVRAFIIRYQDRLLWGMDQGAIAGMSPQDEDRCYRALSDGYDYEFGLYETSGATRVDQVQARGLDLPESVLRKIYAENAATWYPGIFALPATAPATGGPGA
jgi:hypothetical protein